MRGLWKILFALVVLALLAVGQACSSGTELNPQPLPPGGDDNSAGTGSSGGSSSGAFGDTPGTSTDAGTAIVDAGDGGDAADAGDAGDVTGDE